MARREQLNEEQRRLLRITARMPLASVANLASILGATEDRVSRAVTLCTTAVSLFRINVRSSGRHKCHSGVPPWYQILASWDLPGTAALEDPRRPGIS